MTENRRIFTIQLHDRPTRQVIAAKNCWTCPLHDDEVNLCNASHRLGGDGDTEGYVAKDSPRPEWCPLDVGPVIVVSE